MENRADSEKIRIEIQGEGAFSLKKGENVLSVLIEQGLFDTSHCAGHGTCGKCAVRFLVGAPLPKPADRRRFSPEELRGGWRLACMAKPMQDCVIIKPALKKKDAVLDKTLFGDLRAEAETPEKTGETIVFADLGTTTVVLLLVEKQTGRILDTYKTRNSQRKYGADVISRMEQAIAGKDKELAQLVNEDLQAILERWKGDGYRPEKAVLAGNTVMVHLMQGYPVEGLAKAPFEPVTSESVTFDVAGVQGRTVPGISAFVGGDIVAGMLACKKEMDKEGIKKALLIDLGTNGEMVLFTEKQNYCTATAAGPAFEGGFDDSLFGSDVIKMTALLLERGMIDETGLLADEYFETGFSDGEHLFRQQDIRALQTAKAAVFAGIRILLEEAGISEQEVEKIYLAGGFGYYLSVEAACRIGLIPSLWKERTVAAGNTALAGAYLYAQGAETEGMRKNTKSINLAESEKFNGYFLQAMNLREERDFS